METGLLIAIIAGLGGMFGWGLADFFAKKTIDRIGDISTLALGHIFGTLVLFLAVCYRYFVQGQSLTLPQDTSAWLLVLFFGILQAIVYLLLYQGFGKGQLAVLNPVFSSFSGITAILSIVVFSELVTGYITLGLVTLFVGIISMSVDINALKLRRVGFSHIPGFKEVICATLLASLWTLFWDKVISGNDWLMYSFLMYAAMTVFILIIVRIKRVPLRNVVTRDLWKFLVLIGVCETVAYLAIGIGYSTTPYTSIIALLSGAFSLPTIVLAHVFLKEKISRLQTIGSIIIVLGIMFLSL